MTDQELIASFKANGGKVKQIAYGETSEPMGKRDRTTERNYTLNANGVECVTNGYGEQI